MLKKICQIRLHNFSEKAALLIKYVQRKVENTIGYK